MNQNTEITTFAFGDQLIRTVEYQGTPWFLASDVCAVLELGNVSMAIKGNAKSGAQGLDEDEAAITNLDIRSENGVTQTREVLIVSEPGLYRLAFKSRKPEAKVFQKWVFSEVLPQIRRTGSYNNGHQAYLGLIADQIRMGVSPDIAARGAMKLCQPELPPHAIPIRSSSSYHPTITDVEVQELLDVMQPDSAYTPVQLANAMPSRHKLRRGSDPSKRASVGKIMERAISSGRAIRIPGRQISYQLPPIASFAAEQS